MKTGRLWGKRMEKEAAPLAVNFTSGRDVRGVGPADERLIPYDIRGSRAHVVMLAKQKIIPREDARTLIRGLKDIGNAWRKGEFRIDPSQEDVHSSVENFLIQRYGMDRGGRIHTARSRNDQIALDMRLYLRDCALDFIARITSLVGRLAGEARKHQEKIMPGYTHHQPAQVTTLGHVWLAFAGGLLRDGERFQQWYGRFNQNPLGSMTGYSTSFPINRQLTSRLLGFDGPCPNSLDPIQTRWEAEAEMGFAIAALMNHLSSLAQTLILLSTGEFGMVRLDDAFCSGSSMMPQKRNPDPLEIMKAKAAAAQGMLAGLLAIGRALFLGYNRDTQWTKYWVMDLVDECLPAPRVMEDIISTLTLDQERMAALCQKGFITSPDLAERIVHQFGLPFRQAKILVEKAVKYSEEEGCEGVPLSALKRSLDEEGLRLEISDQWVAVAQDPKSIVSRRKPIGGTSPQALEKNIAGLNRFLKGLNQWVEKKRRQQSTASASLARMEKLL